MITQTITASMTQTKLAKILTRRYDVGREIKFILYKDELLTDPIDLTDYTVVITVIKPDNNFVIQNFSGDTVTITEQMEVVTGTGYYCVHISKDNETIYTGQGEFIIDDVLISDEELESISEVNGLRFPDDFLTIDDHVAVIDDDVTSTEKTWSSSKISYEIDNASVEVSKTLEGNPVIFTDGASAPLVKCVTAITGYQSGTGTPSPDNIRPITAYTEGEIEVRGKNLFDKDNVNSITAYVTANSGLLEAGTTEHSIYLYLEQGTYTVQRIIPSSDTTTKRFRFRLFRNVPQIGETGDVLYDGSTELTATITLPYSGYLLIFMFNGDSAWNARQEVFNSMQIEKGSTATTYEPYTSTTHTTTYPSAIYRGSEDVVNGEVTNNYGMLGATDFDTFAGTSSGGLHYAQIDNLNSKIDGLCICNMAEKNNSGAWSSTVPCVQNATMGRIRFYCDCSTLQEFQTKYADLQIVYELATPTTTLVTPTNLPIKSLSGYAHIESSTGDMEVEYITQDYQPLVDSIEKESDSRTTKLWDAGFTPSPGVWLEYDFGEDLENYDAIVIEFVVSGWEGNNSDVVTVYPKIQHLNSKHCYHYVKGTDYGIQFWRVSGTTYGLGSIDGNYPPQYKAVYGIKY